MTTRERKPPNAEPPREQQEEGGGGAGAGGGRQGRAGFGNVSTLHDPPADSGDGRNASRRDGSDQPEQPGPLDKVAEMIGVGGHFVTIPGALGVKKNRVPVIYLMIAAIVVLFSGWKGAFLIVFAYVVINQGRR